MQSPITEFYNNKCVFITGVTGFVGKAVVEKLLRFTDVKKIYILLREKKGKNVQQRLEDIKQNMVFTKVKKEKGESIFSKLVPIAGDIEKEYLQLTEEDKKTLIEDVEIVVHSAATLDFELNAELVINVNLLGTKRLLEFCTRLNNLHVFTYVSTAYVNSDKSFAKEKLYPKIGDITDFYTLFEAEEKEKLLNRLIKSHVNAYTISKALAEHEVDSFRSKFPTAIVRPSMIVGAWREPIPGWTDSKNGPTGFFMGAGMGVIRRLPVNRNLVYDYIPIDMVANEIIAVGWYTATKRFTETQIFHCTSSTVKPFCWKYVDSEINKMLTNYPLKSAVWYPTMKLHKNFTLFRISTLFLHFIPGIFYDTLLKLIGKKAVLTRLHLKVDSSLCRLSPFIYKEWFFDRSNTERLQESMSEIDRKIYDLDIRKINYCEFFEEAVLGVRRFISKEPDDTLEDARKKVKIFFILNCLTQALFLLSVWWAFSLICSLDLRTSVWLVPVTYFLFSFL